MSNKRIKTWISDVSKGKNVAVASRLNDIYPIVDRIVRNIVRIDKIEYIWIGHDRIEVSSEAKLEGKRQKPVTTPGHPTATGFSLIIEFPLKSVQFFEITSATKGYGETMLKAVLDALDPDWEVIIVLDYSHGFWEAMAKKYEQVYML
jgi:hypothetical protein